MRPARFVAGCVLALVLPSVGFAAATQPSDLAAWGFGPGPAAVEGNNGYIGIFADPAATRTCASIAPGGYGLLYVFAILDGGTTPGFMGAEFRIEVTHPEGYDFQYIMPPGTISIGNVFDLTPNDPTDQTGFGIAFHGCQGPSPVPIGTILVINHDGGPTELLVKRGNEPSNVGSYCPLMITCDEPIFRMYAMTPCGFDATGGAIASRASLNDPACTEGRVCATTCDPARCVTLTATVSQPACVGQPITITATATNCSPEPEEIDLFVTYERVGSFTAVPPGHSVAGSRTYLLPDCGNGPNTAPPVGALIRTASCSEPVGREIGVPIQCDSRLCAANRAPDCSLARATVPELWPPDGRLVAESVTGITDPDGDLLTVRINLVTTDERPGTLGEGTCPDAFMDAPNAVRLRAERLASGDGRVYTLTVVAQDPAGYGCNTLVKVGVPRKQGAPCPGSQVYVANDCVTTEPGFPAGGLGVKPMVGVGVEVRFTSMSEADARIDVYDIRGRRVATLGESRFGAGEHVLQWNGRDASGASVASGLYIFRLTSGGHALTAKSVLVH